MVHSCLEFLFAFSQIVSIFFITSSLSPSTPWNTIKITTDKQTTGTKPCAYFDKDYGGNDDYPIMWHQSLWVEWTESNIKPFLKDDGTCGYCGGDNACGTNHHEEGFPTYFTEISDFFPIDAFYDDGSMNYDCVDPPNYDKNTDTCREYKQSEPRTSSIVGCIKRASGTGFICDEHMDLKGALDSVRAFTFLALCAILSSILLTYKRDPNYVFAAISSAAASVCCLIAFSTYTGAIVDSDDGLKGNRDVVVEYFVLRDYASWTVEDPEISLGCIFMITNMIVQGFLAVMHCCFRNTNKE